MSDTNAEQQFLTLNEAAHFMRVSVRSLQREIEGGKGPPLIRLTSRRIVFHRPDLVIWANSRSSGLKTDHKVDRHRKQ